MNKIYEPKFIKKNKSRSFIWTCGHDYWKMLIVVCHLHRNLKLIWIIISLLNIETMSSLNIFQGHVSFSFSLSLFFFFFEECESFKMNPNLKKKIDQTSH